MKKVVKLMDESASLQVEEVDAMKSLSNKMMEAYRLSNFFDYSEGLSDKEYEFISGWQDGLMHKYYEKHARGQCSFGAMIAFDVGEFEIKVESDIERLKKLRGKVRDSWMIKKREFSSRCRRPQKG